jgi:hypothetical protein
MFCHTWSFYSFRFIYITDQMQVPLKFFVILYLMGIYVYGPSNENYYLLPCVDIVCIYAYIAIALLLLVVIGFFEIVEIALTLMVDASLQ